MKRRITAAERRRRIVDAAIEWFAKDGYDRASVDQIAVSAGVTKPVVYDHFESKEAIFVSALEIIRDTLLAMGAEVARSTSDPKKRLKMTLSTFFDFIEEKPLSARVLILGSKGPPSIEAACKRVQAQATEGIARLIKAGQSSPRSRKVEGRTLLLTAEFVKKGMHGLAEWWLDHPEVQRKEVESVLLDVLRNGIGLH
ncbi:MAG: TetR/AcrR family transcriptional regulator [Terracidiphilus sp.]